MSRLGLGHDVVVVVLVMYVVLWSTDFPGGSPMAPGFACGLTNTIKSRQTRLHTSLISKKYVGVCKDLVLCCLSTLCVSAHVVFMLRCVDKIGSHLPKTIAITALHCKLQ